MFRCYQIVCKVDDVSKTVRDYENLGFSMEWGSEPSRAKNALLWFDQGPCIEFHKFPDSLNRFLKFFVGIFYGKGAVDRVKRYTDLSEGWCESVFGSTEYDEFSVDRGNRNLLLLKKKVSDLKKMNISTSKIIKGKRIRADKKKVSYCLVMPCNPEFPMIAGGYSFPQRPKSTIHRNGVSGIKSIKMAVNSKIMEKFKSIYGGEKLLKIEQAERTEIIEVELNGPDLEMNPKFLHGARFV